MALTDLTATATSSTQIDLTWNNTGNYEDIYVYRKRSDESDYTLIASLAGDAWSYSDTGLNHGRSYTYYVKGYVVGGGIENSNTDTATTILPAPTGFSAEDGASADRIGLSWTNGTDQHDGTKIYRDGALIAIVDKNAQGQWAYTDMPLPQGSPTYTYAIEHYTSDATSSQDTDTGYTDLEAPSYLTANISGQNIVLHWTINSEGYESGFKIFRSTDNQNYSQIATVGQGVSSYTDTGPFNHGITYYYRVRAYNSNRESNDSNTASVLYQLADTFTNFVSMLSSYTQTINVSDIITNIINSSDAYKESAYTSLNFNYYLGDSNKVYLFSKEYYGDNGSTITSFWESKKLDFELPAIKKTLSRVRLSYYDYGTHDITVGISLDEGLTWNYQTKTVGTGSRTIKQVFFDWWLTSENFKIKLLHSSSDRRFAWIQMEVEFEIRGEQRQDE